MDCPCPACTGRDSLFLRETTNREEPQQEMHKSIYDKLDEIVDKVSDKLTEEEREVFDEILVQIDCLDNDIHELQKEVITRPVDLTQFRLGEISRKLY